jgi:hypothetical protein
MTDFSVCFLLFFIQYHRDGTVGGPNRNIPYGCCDSDASLGGIE